MHIPRIYVPQPLREHQTIALSKQAAHHIATVMRMKVGREIILFNGQQYHEKLGEFTATITDIHKKDVSVAVSRFIWRATESSIHTELGACLIKNDRMDWLLQKATELGVSKISPLWSDYTDVKIPPERLEKKYHHWQQVVINACEQCGRTSLPELSLPQPLSRWCDHVDAGQKIILHPNTDSRHADSHAASLLNTIAIQENSPDSVALLVGPEGGLSEHEVEQATEKKFQTMALGPRILRAETAPLVALSLIQSHYGDING